MNAPPLERLYPNRCYDCLAVVSIDDVLCSRCKALYGAEKERRERGDVHRGERT